MDDRQFEALLQDSLRRNVSAHDRVLEGLEGRVQQALAARYTPTAARPAQAFLPRWKLSLAWASTAVAALVIGWVLGSTGSVAFNGGSLQGMTFVVAFPEAQRVEVAGDFNGWQPTALHKNKDGIWTLKLDLPPGRYEYAFFVDGVAWKPDPRADEYVTTWYGSTNSVKYISDRRGPS